MKKKLLLAITLLMASLPLSATNFTDIRPYVKMLQKITEGALYISQDENVKLILGDLVTCTALLSAAGKHMTRAQYRSAYNAGPLSRDMLNCACTTASGLVIALGLSRVILTSVKLMRGGPSTPSS